MSRTNRNYSNKYSSFDYPEYKEKDKRNYNKVYHEDEDSMNEVFVQASNKDRFHNKTLYSLFYQILDSSIGKTFNELLDTIKKHDELYKALKNGLFSKVNLKNPEANSFVKNGIIVNNKVGIS